MREISDAGPESVAKAAKEVSGTAVSVEDALAEMYYVMGELYGTTRSVSVDVGDVLTVTGEQIRRATRSSEDTELPENVLYLVNFGDGEGYAVLGADQRLPSVIAITELGSVVPNDFTMPLPDEMYIGDIMIEGLEHLWCEEDQEYYIGSEPVVDSPDWINAQIARVVGIILTTSFDPDESFGGGGTSNGYVTIYGSWTATVSHLALMETKWDQHPPFNDKCPTGSRATESNGRYPAGCVAIAVAQILAYNGTPTAKSLFGVTSTWAELRAYSFLNSSNDTTAFGARMREDIATILKKIGDGCDMNYGFWGNNSFATPNKAKKYLRDKVKYKNVDKYNSYKEDMIISCLSKGCPVFMGAISGTANGHAWVIDGYMKQSRENVKVYSNGETKVVSTETRKLMHCNFGWGGTANGYYISKVFRPHEGPAVRDPNVDTEGGTTSSNVRDYDWWRRIVVYDL